MRRKLLAVLIMLMIPLLFASSVLAKDTFESRENVVLPKDSVVNGNYFAAGEKVTIEGTVNGDVYVAGGSIFIEGTINGDLLVAGGEVTVRGTVRDDVRAAGGDITVSSRIGDDPTAVGGSITIADNAQVAGSLVTAGGTLKVYAPVQRGITAAVGDATIAGIIGGDITSTAGNLDVTSNASVSGNINYWSEKEINVSNGASISGKVTRHEAPVKEREVRDTTQGIFRGIITTFTLIDFLSTLILGLLLLWVIPFFMNGVNTTLTNTPLKSMLVGLLTLIVTPFIIILLFITVLGIPIALMLGVAYVLLIYISKIFVALAVGSFLFDRLNMNNNKYLRFTVGLITYMVIMIIPIIGGIVGFFGLLLGLGSLLIHKRNAYQEMRTRKIL